jgi:hypothetical protein
MNEKRQNQELTVKQMQGILGSQPPQVGSDQLRRNEGFLARPDSGRLLAAFEQLENQGVLILSKCKVCPCCDSLDVHRAIKAAQLGGTAVRGYIALTDADLAEAANGSGFGFEFGVPDEVPSQRFTQVLDALEREIFHAVERHGLEAVWDSEQRLWVKTNSKCRMGRNAPQQQSV